MPGRPAPPLPALLAPLLLLLAAACGDSDSAATTTPAADGTGAAAPSPGVTDLTTVTPTGTATPAATATAAPGATSTPSPSPTAEAGHEEIEAYRYEVTMVTATDALDDGDLPDLGLEHMEMELWVRGERVVPDRERAETVANLGSSITLEIEAVTIGDEQWSREADGEWRSTSASLGGGIPGDVDVRPEAVFGADAWDRAARERLGALLEPHAPEDSSINGMEAERYRLAGDEFNALFDSADQFSAGGRIQVDVDLWVSSEYGIPIGMLITGMTPEGRPALELTLELFDLNDTSLAIEAPVSD